MKLFGGEVLPKVTSSQSHRFDIIPNGCGIIERERTI